MNQVYLFDRCCLTLVPPSYLKVLTVQGWVNESQFIIPKYDVAPFKVELEYKFISKNKLQ